MTSKRSLIMTEKPMTEESWITTEQLALIGFAARLGTSLANDAELTQDGDVREEAQLLMSLLSSKPPSQSLFCEEELGKEPSEDSSTQEHFLRDAFKFTCPSLSLKPTSSEPPSTPPPLRKLSDSDDSLPSLETPVTPAELFGRPLSVDDRNALRLSAEAMARNVMESFHEALLWRIQTWIYCVSRSLVSKEKALVQQLKEGGPSESEQKEDPSDDSKRAALEALLNTSEARLILSLQHVAASIEIMDVKTNFRVLSERVDISNEGDQEQPMKKQRREEYDVKHPMSFQAVLNLHTPAGYTEVMLQAPGVIEGTFAKSAPDEETLTGVVVSVDTGILATTIERSSRIVVRSATEPCVKPPAPEPQDPEDEEEKHSEEQEEEIQQQESIQQEQGSPELVCMPTPTKSSVEFTDLTERTAAVVTPRHPSPPSVYCDPAESSIYLDFGDQDEDDILRTVSPQPKNTDVSSCLFTPRKGISVPSLVSPSPTMPRLKNRKVSQSEEILGSSLPNLSPRKRPSLPVLVEVACAAMRDN